MRINISSFKRGIKTLVGKFNFTFTIKLLNQIWKQFMGHRCLQQAGALAFNSILSLIPLLAVAFFLLNAFYNFPDALPLNVDSKFQSDLETGDISEDFRRECRNHRISLSSTLSIEEKERSWLIIDEKDGKSYTVNKFENGLDINPPDSLPFSIDAKFQVDLETNSISEEFRRRFGDNDVSISGNVSVEEKERIWQIKDEDKNKKYTIKKKGDGLNIYRNADSVIITYIRDNFLPQYRAEDIADKISEFTSRINMGKLGFIAFFPLLLISMLLFNAIESIFNDIWEVKASRHIFYKSSVFYVILTTGPILVALSIYQAEKVEMMAGQNGSSFLSWILGNFIPFFFMWLAIVLAYKLLPNTNVKWMPVLAGALLASVMIEVTKTGFGYYLSNFVGAGYDRLYESIVFIPILAVWIYMSWLIILFGTEFVHVYQNAKKLHLKEAIQGPEPTVGNDKVIFINSILAIKLFLAVAENFYQHGNAIPKSDISLKFGIPEDIVDRIFKYYRESNLIWDVEGDTEGYIPARPLEDIYLNQVVDAFEGKLEELVSYGETLEPLQMLNYQLTAARHDIINGINVSSLLSAEKRKRIEGGLGIPALLEDKSQNNIE